MSISSTKLVVIGDGMVGKTALLNAFANDTFVDDYVPTIFETSAKDIEIKGETFTLGLWDTGGQEEFDKVRILAYPGAEIILMCYCVEIGYSLDNILLTWHPELTMYCPDIPVILVGCKSDLRVDESMIENELVPLEDVEKMCQRIGAKGHIECSAKTRDNVNKVFEMAAEIYLDDRSNRKVSRVSKFMACFPGRRKKKSPKI